MPSNRLFHVNASAERCNDLVLTSDSEIFLVVFLRGEKQSSFGKRDLGRDSERSARCQVQPMNAYLQHRQLFPCCLQIVPVVRLLQIVQLLGELLVRHDKDGMN